MKISNCEVTLRKVDGTELDIVNAARVSFHKESTWNHHIHLDCEFDALAGKDINLINYLASHGHWTPFGHVNATFVIKAPIFVARQLGKHQVGLVWNEVSRRYVDDEPEFFYPDGWRGKPVNAKQGSDGVVTGVFANELSIHFHNSVKESLMTYNMLLEGGVAPEQARMILPQNMMTEWWWTGSLAAWSRIFKLRLDPHTQKETQDIAQEMYNQLLPSFPNALQALLK
jgi:thymidylate synthase (FAD)